MLFNFLAPLAGLNINWMDMRQAFSSSSPTSTSTNSSTPSDTNGHHSHHHHSKSKYKSKSHAAIPQRAIGFGKAKIGLLIVLAVVLVSFVGLNISLSSHAIPADYSTKAQLALLETLQRDQWLQKPRQLGKCSSPEIKSKWPLKGPIVSTFHPNRTCGVTPQTHKFMGFLIRWGQMTRRHNCSVVVYGVAFGTDHVLAIQRQRHTLFTEFDRYGTAYDECFYVVTLESAVNHLKRAFPGGRARIIGVPSRVLPFANHRRNVKFFKFIPHILFPHAHKIIWQDLKFFRTSKSVHFQPLNFTTVFDREQAQHDACVTVTGLPGHESSIGRFWKTTQASSMEHHCDTIVRALAHRPTVTDSPQGLRDQCEFYLQSMEHDVLNQGMIDTAFMVWHYHNRPCRQFNAQLQCEILNQIYCYSDRDQLAIPYAVGLMNLTKKGADTDNTRYYDYQLVRAAEPTQNLIHVVRSACHWYFHRIGECLDNTNDEPSLAIMVVGTLTRFQLNSTIEHVLLPMRRQGKQVDYFLNVSQSPSPVYRGAKAPYARMRLLDPIVNNTLSRTRNPRMLAGDIGKYFTRMDIRGVLQVARDGGDSGNEPKSFESDPRIVERLEMDKDLYRHFPSLDARPGKEAMAAVGNRNMLALFYNLEFLWWSVKSEEIMRGKEYDYVLIIRDDAVWLQDFDLEKILEYGITKGDGNQTMPDAYVLSCDARKPAMLSAELCDHAILVRRPKAHIFARYFSQLTRVDLEKCHKMAQKEHGFPTNRGCNSEMILQFIAKANRVTIQTVPQSLLPFQRAVPIMHKNGTVEYCLHKFCQSNDLPLEFPKPLRKCSEVREGEVPDNFTAADELYPIGENADVENA